MYVTLTIYKYVCMYVRLGEHVNRFNHFLAVNHILYHIHLQKDTSHTYVLTYVFGIKSSERTEIIIFGIG